MLAAVLTLVRSYIRSRFYGPGQQRRQGYPPSSRPLSFISSRLVRTLGHSVRLTSGGSVCNAMQHLEEQTVGWFSD